MDKRSTGEMVLKEKYQDLPNSTEVVAAVEGYKHRNKVDINYKPIDRIAIYITRLDEIIHDGNTLRRDRSIDILKRDLYRHVIIRPEQIPTSYWAAQKQTYEEKRGLITWNEFKQRKAEDIITGQRESLGLWVDQLSSPNSPYPTWIKYWALRSVLGMGTYDPQKHTFAKRNENTINPFPELNEEALSHVLNVINKKYPESLNRLAMNESELRRFLQLESFGTLYGSAIEKLRPISDEEMKDTRGGWALFPAKCDPTTFEPEITIEGDKKIYKGRPLVPSTQRTGWCITTAYTAKAELADGDLHIFYSLDRDGNPTIPRVAIRTVKGRIIEVSGLSKYQNLDPRILEVVAKKLQTFGDEGRKFGERRIKDTRILNTIVNKAEYEEPLTDEELAFLQRTDVQTFGYKLDPIFKKMKDRYSSNLFS